MIATAAIAGRSASSATRMDDAEERLRDNLDGLDWLVPQLDGQPAGPAPKPAHARAAAAGRAPKAQQPRRLADAALLDADDL